MGNSVSDHQRRHQQPESHQLSVFDIPNNVVMERHQRILRMAESKIALLLLNMLGIPLYGYTLFTLWNTTQGWILFFIAALFGIAKLFFYIKRQFQAIHKDTQEASLRELEIKKRHREDKALELQQLEEELSLRITGLTTAQRRKDGNNFTN